MLLEIQTVGWACIGLNTDRLPWRRWSEDHHMWKLPGVECDGGLEVVLLVLEGAAHQAIRICDKIGVDVVESQGRYVSWLVQIVWSVHREELAGRQTILQFPALPRWYTQRARHRTAKVGMNPKPHRHVVCPGVVHYSLHAQD